MQLQAKHISIHASPLFPEDFAPSRVIFFIGKRWTKTQLDPGPGWLFEPLTACGLRRAKIILDVIQGRLSANCLMSQKLNQPHLERFPFWLWRNFHSRVDCVSGYAAWRCLKCRQRVSSQSRGLDGRSDVVVVVFQGVICIFLGAELLNQGNR